MKFVPDKQVFDSPIFRIIPDTVSGHLLVETRPKGVNEGKKISPHFFFPREVSGPIVPTFSYPEGWGVHAFACYDQHIILQGYVDQTLPETGRVWVYHIPTATYLWEASHLKALSITEEGVWARELAFPYTTRCYALQTGQVQSTVKPFQPVANLQYAHLRFPHTVEASQHFMGTDGWKLQEGEYTVLAWTEQGPQGREQYIRVDRGDTTHWTHHFPLSHEGASEDVFFQTGQWLIALEPLHTLWIGNLIDKEEN